MVCAFSGHRPERLPWGSDEADPRCKALQFKLRQAVAELAGQGYDTFLCGMARGCDIYFFDAVQALRVQQPELKLIAVIPCPSQPDAWPQQDRLRYASALSKCSAVQIVSDHFYNGCMLERNRRMVDQADLLLTVWDGTHSGTASTVRYARQHGVPIRALWL